MPRVQSAMGFARSDPGGAGSRPGEHRLEQDADRKQIGAGGDLAPLALLGAQRGQRAEISRGDRRRRIGRVRGAEVGESRRAGGVEEHVGRLDVAVQDAEAVRVAEGGQDRSRDLGRPGRGDRSAPHHLLEGPSFHPGQDHRRPCRVEVADRNDRCVVERLQRSHVAFESSKGRARWPTARGVDLHRDLVAAGPIQASEDSRARRRRDLLDHFVAAVQESRGGGRRRRFERASEGRQLGFCAFCRRHEAKVPQGYDEVREGRAPLGRSRRDALQRAHAGLLPPEAKEERAERHGGRGRAGIAPEARLEDPGGVRRFARALEERCRPDQIAGPLPGHRCVEIAA